MLQHVPSCLASSRCAESLACVVLWRAYCGLCVTTAAADTLAACAPVFVLALLPLLDWVRRE
jgi:hypothetical protein